MTFKGLQTLMCPDVSTTHQEPGLHHRHPGIHTGLKGKEWCIIWNRRIRMEMVIEGKHQAAVAEGVGHTNVIAIQFHLCVGNEKVRKNGTI